MSFNPPITWRKKKNNNNKQLVFLKISQQITSVITQFPYKNEKSRRSPFFPVVIHTHVSELCLPKKKKTHTHKKKTRKFVSTQRSAFWTCGSCRQNCKIESICCDACRRWHHASCECLTDLDLVSLMCLTHRTLAMTVFSIELGKLPCTNICMHWQDCDR